MIIELL